MRPHGHAPKVAAAFSCAGSDRAGNHQRETSAAFRRGVLRNRQAGSARRAALRPLIWPLKRLRRCHHDIAVPRYERIAANLSYPTEAFIGGTPPRLPATMPTVNATGRKSPGSPPAGAKTSTRPRRGAL
ncbi:MAG: hypothetical protein ACLSAH_12440 [Bilophila wadsworthia]